MLLDNQLSALAAKDIWILDVDGFMYEIDSLFSKKLYPLIARNFNLMLNKDPLLLSHFKAWLGKNYALSDVQEITAANLKAAYVPIIQTFIQMAGSGSAAVYMDELYGHGDELIDPDPRLVRAFVLAKSKGVEIFFNSNGPSGKNADENLHTQRIMKALGFDQEMIEYMRSRTWNIVDAVRAGRQKGNPDSICNDFFPFAGITDSKKAFMADDGVKHLVAASEVGLLTIWAWTSDSNPKPAEIDAAKEIGAVRIRNVGETLLQIADRHL